MLSKQDEEILEKYRSGSDIGYIVEKMNIPFKTIQKTIDDFKEANRLKKSFTDEFKMLIAERDINGVSRRQIAQELGINALTVKKACEEFGQANKEKADSESKFTRIELKKFSVKTCPSCKSRKVNLVEDNTIYCKKCGSEHSIHKIFEDKTITNEKGEKEVIQKEVGAYALKINWEYVE